MEGNWEMPRTKEAEYHRIRRRHNVPTLFSQKNTIESSKIHKPQAPAKLGVHKSSQFIQYIPFLLPIYSPLPPNQNLTIIPLMSLMIQSEIRKQDIRYVHWNSLSHGLYEYFFTRFGKELGKHTQECFQ